MCGSGDAAGVGCAPCEAGIVTGLSLRACVASTPCMWLCAVRPAVRSSCFGAGASAVDFEPVPPELEGPCPSDDDTMGGKPCPRLQTRLRRRSSPLSPFTWAHVWGGKGVGGTSVGHECGHPTRQLPLVATPVLSDSKAPSTAEVCLPGLCPYLHTFTSHVHTSTPSGRCLSLSRGCWCFLTQRRPARASAEFRPCLRSAVNQQHYNKARASNHQRTCVQHGHQRSADPTYAFDHRHTCSVRASERHK